MATKIKSFQVTIKPLPSENDVIVSLSQSVRREFGDVDILIGIPVNYYLVITLPVT